MCIDANARLGSQASCAVGEHESEAEDLNSPLFHQFLLAQGLLATSTFASCSAPLLAQSTWQSSSGRWHRLEYICIPQSGLGGCSFVAPLPELEVATVRIDHVPVVATLRGSTRAGSRWVDQRKLRFSKEALADSANVAAFDFDLAQLSLVPWHVDIQEHYGKAIGSIVELAAKHFKGNGHGERPSWISAQTWALSRRRSTAVGFVHSGFKDIRWCTLGFAFQAWASVLPEIPAEQHPWSPVSLGRIGLALVALQKRKLL